MNVDVEEIRAYAERGCEEAFRRLVQRHVQLVYSVALRRVGGEHSLAEEISQMVFLDLARKAVSLPRNVILAGWLHRHTCFVASSTLRRESRRREREKKASEMSPPDGNGSDSWTWIAPILDNAINRLSGLDRTALLLRFYENQDVREVARALDVTEAAAQKRISRALERLRLVLSGPGEANVSSSGLASLLSSHAVTTIPAHVATGVGAAALAGLGTAGAATTITQIVAMTTMAKIKAGVLGALIIGMAVPLGLQHQSLKELRAENANLLEEANQSPELEDLREENQRLREDLAEPALARNEFSELLRLRGEVGQLRQKNSELAKAKKELQDAKAETAKGPVPMQTTDELADQIQSAKAVILDPGEAVHRKLAALRVLRSADARSDDIVREMVSAYYSTGDQEARADIFRQLHGVHTPELKRPLVEAVSDPANRPELREEAAETLEGYTSDPNITAWLEHVAQHDENPKVREQASRSLEGFRQGK